MSRTLWEIFAEFDEPPALCHDCGWELGACNCLIEPKSDSMTAREGNLPGGTRAD